MNFVIDTNVIVSSLYRSPSVPNDIILFAFNNKNNFVYYTEEILLEYEDVLNRKKFNFDNKSIKNFLLLIKQKAVFIQKLDYYFNSKMVDNDNRKFYELAKSYSCYLIIGNKKHYPNDPIVMTPQEFMNKLHMSA